MIVRVAELTSNSLTHAILLGLLGALVARFLISSSRRRSLKLPTGPPPMPVFGNALSLKDDDGFLDQLLAWSREYGTIYSMYIGQTLVVVVSGLEMIREVTIKRGLDFGDRADVPTIWRDYNPKRLGIFDAIADDTWRKQRKFAHSTLRGIGFGKVLLEPMVQEEAQRLIQYFKEKGGKDISPKTGMRVSASNLITQLIIRRRLDYESNTADQFVTNMHTLIDNKEKTILKLFPCLWPVIKYNKHWRNCARAAEIVHEFINEEIAVRQRELDAAQGAPHVDDFVKAYLVHAKDDPETFTVESLVNVVLDLFLGGTDTTATTLTWSTIYLATNPENQHRIHDEIMKEVGNAQIAMSHRSFLPYTQAAILEAQRLASLVPLVPRKPSQDAELAGYDIPRGTMVFINLWSPHHDPEVWPDPLTFNPERFLDKDGSLKHSDYLQPFSNGKRICIGEQLAKMTLFVFFASMVQQLKFSVPVGCEAPSYHSVYSIFRQPRPFKLHIAPR